MFTWRNRKTEASGTVLFRGSIPPRADDFAHLEQLGVRISAAPAPAPAADANTHWTLRCTHDAWGDATLTCLRGPRRVPRLVLDHDAGLTDDERAEAAAGETAIVIDTVGRRGDVLRDRKSLLRYLGAVMGRDGCVAVDRAAMRLWSRPALDDELAHDADLDVESLYALHAVWDGPDTAITDNAAVTDNAPDNAAAADRDGRCTWLHSHGLAEIGFFDFDILNPAGILTISGSDAPRAIAFAILDGLAARNTPRFELASPGGAVRFLDVADFQRRADPATRALRCGAGADHDRDRAVLCEPARRFLGRWFDKPKPSKFLSSGFDEEGVLHFSSAATHLMEERAQKTYPLFRRLAAELAEFDLPVLAKLGYEIDGGTDREYMWFQVDRLHDDALDGTLINEPFAIARMKVGDRGTHPVERMNDWQILTPVGAINPRSTRAAREIRANAAGFREMMNAAKGPDA